MKPTEYWARNASRDKPKSTGETVLSSVDEKLTRLQKVGILQMTNYLVWTASMKVFMNTN
ncbi:hypothetical protein T265_10355 [Opisthorchis viverrini]|uniref:Uncharacterized protein n=1 Tax=Opisthorchis viverrini TaxID=6198 RepID=A0A074ZDL8_OPIVI|nr:hypothetical protein T265_10355 [Opisthorchis viverrini]KER21295.1 hypothetical protein T265_10355 [Opisthorchis viverrini]